MVEAEIGRLGAGYWPLPEMAIDALSDPVPRMIRPICDYIYQTFGVEESPSFDAEGNWRGRP